MAQRSAVLQPLKTATYISERGQSTARCCKKRGSYLPIPEQRRIQSRFIEGHSIRQISRDTGRHQDTVARIVKTEEMQQYAKTLREKVFGLGDDAVERIRTEIRSGKEGAWLAYQILKDIGALVEPVVQPQPVVAGEQSEEDGIRRIAIALVDGGLRRQKFFGLPLPELDEAEQFKNIDD